MGRKVQQIIGIGNLFFCDSIAQNSNTQGLMDQFDQILRITAHGEKVFTENDSHKQLTFNPEPCLNILGKLDEAVAFIRCGLQTFGETRGQSQSVLIVVESTVVLEASYAILLATTMQACQTTYSKALRMVRSSFPDLQISTNVERQLRIWEFCGYSIFKDISFATSPTAVECPLKMPGAFPLGTDSTPNDTIRKRSQNGDSDTHKLAYEIWVKEHKAIVAAKRIAAHQQKAAEITAHRQLKLDKPVLSTPTQENLVQPEQQPQTSKHDWLKSRIHDQQRRQCFSVHEGLHEHLNITIQMLT